MHERARLVELGTGGAGIQQSALGGVRPTEPLVVRSVPGCCTT
jgi:hypothetical protein